MTKSPSSLNPEFDAANEAILNEIAKTKGVDLICELCGAVYEYNNHNKPGMYCSVKNGGSDCGGQIHVEEDVMINLPDSVKTGKKGGSTGQQWNNSGPGYQGYSGGTTVWESHKHPGDKVIFEHEGKKLYASNNHSIDEKSGKWDLIIDLAGVVSMPKASAFIREDMPERFQGLKPFLDKDEELPSEVLRLYWADMGVPPCGVEFWENMWEILPEKTVAACIGGHGRTGTCIASLMIAAGETYWDALDHVRKEHCHKAVENLTQEKYLHFIYIEKLQFDLKDAREKNNDLQLIKDIVEDIEYAKAHPPTYTPKVVEVKGNGSNPTVPFPQDSNNTTSIGGFKSCNCDSMASHHTPCPIHAEVPAWAGDLKQKIKQMGDQIFVEECINKYCATVDCDEPAHQGWVKWDLTEEGVV